MGGAATAAHLGGPTWLYRSASGEIYVPDNSFNNIRKIDASGKITTFAGTGGLGNSGDGGPALAATFTLPNGITFDETGNAYIADYGASVVRKVNTAGIISRVAGTGTSGYNGDGIPATSAQVTPNTVTCDVSGNVYIADVNNNRIRRISYNTTKVDEAVKTSQNLTLYPNPAHDNISINAGEKIESVVIINIIGQKVYECSNNNAKKTEVDVSSYPNGVYSVKVNGVYGGRFVKE